MPVVSGKRHWRAAAVMTGMLLLGFAAAAAESIAVGSKRFTESYILGEIVTQRLQAADDVRAVHRQGLG
ncbi:MAG TPA: amino acid ABC transporter permease, partial [Burkholderiales bacterium]|nr:amino acid ABC transporter permease [Burkholderiales bacterium]